MKHLCWLWAAVVLLCSPAAQAGKAELEAAAREYYRAASVQFEAKHYLEAQAGFAAGYELSHKPGFLWNMAECTRLLGNQSRARELYKQYLKDAPAAAPQRADAEQRLKELEAPAAAAPPSPPHLPIAAGAASRPPTPLPPPLAPRLAAAPAAALSPPGLRTSHETSTPLTKRWWFWTGAGAVVAATVVTVVAVSVRGSASPGPAAPSGNFTVNWRSQ